MIGLRETLLALFLWLGQDPVSADVTSVLEPEPPVISCQGQAVQAGLLICSAPTATQLNISGINGEAWRRIPVNPDGLATIGLLRTEVETVRITAVGASLPPLTVNVATRTDPFRIIEGMDCDKVDARTDAQKAHAGRSWVKKQDAFKRFEAGQGGVNGFMRPARGPMSSPFGPARKYIGVGVDGVPCERTRIHYGYDIATPVGTPIYAPASGIVTLGDPDLYYEGGTIFLDHGEGLVSVFMHMSEI
ncbi:MAG: M23 family metallopeptidase, partial [Pseudomonadota bacterium]